MKIMQTVTARQLRVLLIEDDEDDYILLRETLAEIRSTRYDLDWVSSYDEGLEALRRQAYDICLLDYRLGSRNGVDLLREPEVLESETAFILLTGQGNRELDLEAMEAGATDYLAKGEISAALLERSIRYAVGHRRTVTMLRASEQRFRALIEHASDAISLLALDGSILYTSPSITQIMGYTPEEFVRFNAFELVHPDDIPYVTGLFQKLLEIPGSEVEVQYRLRDHGGSWRWMEGIGTNLLHEPSVQAIVTNYRDVTERKLAEEQLRFQAYLLNTVGQAVIATDMNRTVLYWNHAAEMLYGKPSHEIVGRSMLEAVVAEMSPEQVREQRARLALGQSWTGEFMVRRWDGVRFPALVTHSPLRDENGAVVGIIGVSQDVTERREADERVRQSEQQYRTLFETMAQGVIYQDTAGQIIAANPAAERILGLTFDQMQGRTSMDPRWHAIHEDGSAFPGENHPITMALRTGKVVTDKVMGVFNAREDEYRWISVSATPQFREGDQQPYQVHATFDDITDRKRRERELEAIVTVSAALRNAKNRGELVEIILDYMLTLGGSAAAGLVRLNLSTQEAEVELGRGSWANRTGMHWPIDGPTLTTYVLETGQPYMSNQLDAEPLLRSGARTFLGNDVEAIVCIPLIAQEQALGVLWIGKKRAFTPAEVHLLTAIGEIAASAIHRATLTQQTEERLQRLTVLRTIDLAITSSLDLHVTLDVLLNHVTVHLGADAASVLVLDPQSFTLRYAAGQGFRSGKIKQTSIRLGQGLTGRAALERRSVTVLNMQEVREDFVRRFLLTEEGFSTYHAVPLVAKGQTKGVLELFHRSPFKAEQEWQDFLETLAGQAAIAVDSATLFDSLQRSNIELALAYDATIEGWSRALDLRDKETEGHSLRVTEMTVELARMMGMSEEEIVQVRRGALLHDIGKMGIPDRILLKPGALDEEEWEIMRRHPTYGYEMLAPIAFLRPALDIPYAHHEKWDGTGYPRGLQGEQIPLAARIFAVVDVWDALRSHRPYRPAWEKERVLEHIRQGAGKHFDPRMVTSFLEMMSQDRALYS